MQLFFKASAYLCFLQSEELGEKKWEVGQAYPGMPKKQNTEANKTKNKPNSKKKEVVERKSADVLSCADQSSFSAVPTKTTRCETLTTLDPATG